jgi:hypothetical protein
MPICTLFFEEKRRAFRTLEDEPFLIKEARAIEAETADDGVL